MVATTAQVSGPGARGPRSRAGSTTSAPGKSSARAPGCTAQLRNPVSPPRRTSVRAAGEPPNTTNSGRGRRGSRKTSRAPPLGQVVATVSSPRCRAALAARAGTMWTSRGSPSARARSDSRRTSGSAQLPPIQPRSLPSAVITALSPGRAEAGCWVRTTVASTHGVPALVYRASSSIGSSSIGPPGVNRGSGPLLGHPLGAQRRPDLVRGHRHVEVGDPEGPEGVDDGVDVGGRGADGGRLADSLRPQRVVRGGGDGGVALEPGRLPGRGQQVVHEV